MFRIAGRSFHVHELMTALSVCGLNHKTAELSLRERVAFGAPELKSVLSDIQKETKTQEIVLLSTCNRTELYVPDHRLAEVEAWLASRLQVPKDNQWIYTHRHRAALEHVLRVATGLDSMVLGEPQIFGQLKKAVALSEEAGLVSDAFSRLFQFIFSATKKIRTQTGVGVHPLSMAKVAVSLAQKIFENLQDARVLLVGSGETTALVAHYLKTQAVASMTIAARNMEKASHLASECEGMAVPLASLSERLPQADIVITSTAAALPLIGKGMVESALKKRKQRPMLMIDLAVPRDIEPEIAALNGIFLYTVDDLETVSASHLAKRQEAAVDAEAHIQWQVDYFLKQADKLKAVSTIKALRATWTQAHAQGMQQALLRLKKGESPEVVLKSYAHKALQKALHTPSLRLHEASLAGRWDEIAAIRAVFDLDKETT